MAAVPASVASMSSKSGRSEVLRRLANVRGILPTSCRTDKVRPTYMKRARRSAAPQETRVPEPLFDEQHLAIRGERPQPVRNHQLELIARLTQRGHRGDDDVPDVF